MLAHQAMVDAVWQNEIVPVLEKQFPGASEIEIKNAHAYAYGGAIIPDMGYFPLGSHFFTDLVHYVRSGEFVYNLISEASTREELAFALGALAHYYGDVHGHKLATNPSVPLVYPKTRKLFGNVVTYEEDPVAHLRMEFGFDVLQAARGNFAPEAYRNFIGFKVPRALLERAFYKTYGLKLKQTFVYNPVAEQIYRLSIKAIIPQFTKISWQWKDKEAMQNKGSLADQKVAGLLRKSSFKEVFSRKEDKPGVSAQVMAASFRYVPKLGILKTLDFAIPTPEAEALFAESFEAALQDYSRALQILPEKLPRLPDYDLDTGFKAHLGEYKLADQTYSRLLNKLADKDFRTASKTLKTETWQYFANIPPPPDYRR